MHIRFLFTIGFSAAIASMEHPGNYSSSLREFLNTFLAGCSISVYLEPNNPNSTSHFAALVDHYDVDSRVFFTFYLAHYTKEYNIKLLGNSEIGFGATFPHLGPFWIFKKYATCHSQLNYFDTYEMVNAVLASYVGAVFYKLEPQFLLMWDTNGRAKRDLSGYFERPEFQGSLTSYRLYISRVNKESEYTVQMICLDCSAYLTALRKPFSVELLQQQHKDLYRKSTGNTIVYYCVQNDRWCSGKKLVATVAQVLNASSTVVFGYWYYKYNAYLTNIYPLEATNVEFLFLRAYWPASHYVGSSLVHEDVILLTVVPITLLQSSGLSSLVSCLQPNVWICFTIGLLIVLVFLRSTTSRSKDMFQDIWLFLWAPMTDHWMNVVGNPFVSRVVLLWSLLCWSLTLLYGGTIATSLTVLTAPEYPVALEHIGTNVVSLETGVHSNLTVSVLAYRINATARDIVSGLQTGLTDSYKHTILLLNSKLADRLNTHNCPTYELINTHLPTEFPFTCAGANFTIAKNKPLTFVGYLEQIRGVQAAFMVHNNYWISPQSRLPMFRTPKPVIIMKNFFVKLAEPIVASWWTHGLEKHWSSGNSGVKLSDSLGRSQTFTSASGRSSILNEYSAAQLTSIRTLSPIFYILVAFSILIFIAENFRLWISLYNNGNVVTKVYNITMEILGPLLANRSTKCHSMAHHDNNARWRTEWVSKLMSYVSFKRGHTD